MTTVPAVASKSQTTPAPLGPCRVLIADDEHLIATGLGATVARLGHEVVAIAPDGEQAILLATQHKPDLALLDIRMPKVTGIDAAAMIYSQLGIPTIIVTAYSDEEHLSRVRGYGEGSGVYGYLLKPVSPEELRVTIGVTRQRAAVDAQQRARVAQLEHNLTQRRLVEQAKWILVEKHKLTEQQAHEKLQRTARDQRRPLGEVAQGVIDTGELPS